MSVAERIKQGAMCKVINLSEAEKDIYRGAGYRLAWFEDGQLKELYNPMAQVDESLDLAKQADKALDIARDWLNNKTSGETWFVMCSGYELCDPVKVDIKTGEGLAKYARIVGQVLVGLSS